MEAWQVQNLQSSLVDKRLEKSCCLIPKEGYKYNSLFLKEGQFSSVQLSCSIVSNSLGLEWKLTFSSPMATDEFSKFAGIFCAALSQHHLLGFETAQLEFHHLH